MSGPEIICISANPAMDRRLRIAELRVGEVNRAKFAEALPGGKAAHVAMAATALGARAIWLGFAGGGNGEALVEGLLGLGIHAVPIQTGSSTRVNAEVIEDSGRITEILEPGSPPDETERLNLISHLVEGLGRQWKGALVVISGSLPLGTPPQFYKEIIAAAHANGAKVFLDTSGDALGSSFEANPDFIKPNRSEAAALLDRPIVDFDSAIAAAHDAVKLGARSAAVTLGADGLVWLESADGPAWIARPPRLKAISTVACGDTTVAGFAFAHLRKMIGESALRLAAACGAANCLAVFEGRISKADVDALTSRIEIEAVNTRFHL